ncbi:response regulator [Pantoea dispersa]|uniref:response regulator n=1 Tax=Pantoea dispersa TaxID=59814 RepID=UPI001331256B|nr:response regulator [Pantoea dispersa]KAF0856428.1 hypothetical protein Y788_07980 [Pantoea dispersa 625]
MRLFFLCALCCALLLVAPLRAAVQQLNYQPNDLPAMPAPMLNDSDWHWLGQKRDSVIGIYGPDRPPMLRTNPEGRVFGYIPDAAYAALHSLGISFRVKHYDTAPEAFAALAREELDMIFVPAGEAVPAHVNDTISVTALKASPVRVVRSSSNPLAGQEFLPGPAITSPYSQLPQVAMGTLPYADVPAVEAYYLIERNYLNTLTIDHILPDLSSPYRFVVNSKEHVLARAMRIAFDALQRHAAGEIIAARWDIANITRFVTTPLALTPTEQAWLQTHNQINMAVTDLVAPFFIKNAQGEITGIVPELLNLIEMRTGLSFNFIEISDSRDLTTRMKRGDVTIAAPLIWSQQRSRDFLMTTPFMFTPEVLVTNTAAQDAPPKRAALVREQDASHWFLKKYPDVSVDYVGNPSLAMQWVADGQTDATINTLVGARYLSEGLYPGKLRLTELKPAQEAAIAFGVSRSEPELQDIMNKALAAIPAGMMTDVLTHWQATPAAHFDTWKLYRKEFYVGALGAATIIAVTFVWAVLLMRQVKRTRRTKALLRQEIQLRDRLINGPPRPFYVASLDGMIVHTNPAFTQFFTPEEQTHLGYSLYDCRHPLYHVWQQIDKNIQPGDIPEEAEFVIDDGRQKRHIRHWMTSYTGDEVGSGGLICGWQDVTDYLQLLEDLSLAREATELASQSKSDFLATMSHEIRTPLSAVIGLLELQTQEGRADTELIRVAHEAAVSLMDIVGDILDMAKIESGRMTLQPQWVSLHALVRPVICAFDGLARQKGINLNLMLPVGDDDLFCDASRVRQVLSNLVGNAVKFTDQGEVKVTVGLTPLESHTELRIQVADTGRGIDKAAQNALFLPFEQAGLSDNAGTGLGLFICQEITRLMGGSISLESEPGVGTVLNVAVPVSVRDIATPLPSPVAEPLPAAPQVALNVLIIDDHPANRLLISRQLTLLGHSFREANNGEEGLAQWRQQKPDVIITDCNMPVMNGLDMTRNIRREDKSTYIIGITANAQQSERQRCLEAGMNECVFRPVKLAQLTTILSQIHSASALSVGDDFSDWVDIAEIEKYMPNSPGAIADFLDIVINEARTDLTQAIDVVQSGDLATAASLFHRITGSLRVTGIRQLTEQCEMLEELAEMQEDREIILLHLREALTLVDRMEASFRNQTTPAQAGAH